MNKKTVWLATTALLAALMFVLGLTPLGYIPIGPIQITLMCVPVAIGTLVMGLKCGLFLGLMFGVTSLIRSLMAPSEAGLLVPLLDMPVVMYTCIFVPRLLVPLAVYGTQKLLSRAPGAVATGVAAVAGSLCNTVAFLGLIYVLGAQQLAQAFSMSTAAVAKTFVVIAATNGLPEAAVAAIVCIPVVHALRKSKGFR
nr:ECF transporter S component [bacterium]